MEQIFWDLLLSGEGKKSGQAKRSDRYPGRWIDLADDFVRF
jgi:hypothetical protein